MVFVSTCREEQEVQLRFDVVDDCWYVCSTSPKYSKQYIKKLGEPYKTSTNNGKVTCAFWKIDSRQVRVTSNRGLRAIKDKEARQKEAQAIPEV